MRLLGCGKKFASVMNLFNEIIWIFYEYMFNFILFTEYSTYFMDLLNANCVYFWSCLMNNVSDLFKVEDY